MVKTQKNTVEGIVESKKNKKQSNNTKDKDNYIFPKFMADAMSKVDLRLQYESGMMSMSLMAVGLVVSIVYMCIYMDLKLWYKIFLGINGLAGLVFIAGYVITTYQQYKTYLGVVNFQKEMASAAPTIQVPVNKEVIKERTAEEISQELLEKEIKEQEEREKWK